jgi:hypothetical protein
MNYFNTNKEAGLHKFKNKKELPKVIPERAESIQNSDSRQTKILYPSDS